MEGRGRKAPVFLFMAFSVTLYQFSKTANSTVRPSGAGVAYNCVLKDSCGIMAPVLKMDLGLTSDPSQYNYAYIPAFSRYYYISEWEFSERLWVAYLEEDVLATWKTYIGSESFYVLRSAAQYDGTITDDMYPTFPLPDVVQHEGSERPFLPVFNQGSYVVGVINNAGDAVGAVSYYVFTQSQFRTLCARLMDNTDWLSVPKDFLDGGIDDNLLKTLFNPFQYIVSCKWFPFTPPSSGTLSSMPYGWWTLNDVSCNKLGNGGYYNKEITFNLSKHPQAVTRGAYLNSGPFSTMELYFEPFGSIVLDPSYFVAYSSLSCLVAVDCVSGMATLNVDLPIQEGQTYPTIIKTATADFAVNIQIAQMGVDRLTQAETVVAGGASVARDALATASQATNVTNLLNPISGELSAASSGAQTVVTAAHAIADGVRSSIPQMQTSGMNGSLAAFSTIPTLRQSFYRLVEEDQADTGRPYCKIAKPQDLGGYMLVRNANITFPGTVNEISAVKAYLEGGFYYN